MIIFTVIELRKKTDRHHEIILYREGIAIRNETAGEEYFAPKEAISFSRDLAADTVTMDKAADYIDPATRQNFVENRLVVIMPKDAKWDGKDLAALLDDKALKRIAIAHVENVPVGRYTKGALEKAGLWDKLGERNLPTQNVRQSLDYVARGEADAGFVYATDAAIMPDKVKIVLEVPLDKPLVYPIAVLKSSKAADESKRFVAFVTGADGQKILQGYGFSAPAAAK